MNVQFADTNAALIFKLRRAGYKVEKRDYYEASREIDNVVLMTASNPRWTFGGGIDYYVFATYFPELVAEKMDRKGGMERIGNICFCITVDDSLQATKECVEQALRFAKKHTQKHETLLLSGVGTGIGGLSLDEFVEAVQEVFPIKK